MSEGRSAWRRRPVAAFLRRTKKRVGMDVFGPARPPLWRVAGREEKGVEHRLEDGGFVAVIKADGAELVSLRDPSGVEYIWQAGPQWPRHAPVLFPIVGRLKDDALAHEGVRFPMAQHGFARDSRFCWLGAGSSSACRLLLVDSEATRAKFPFPFRLEIGYRLSQGALYVRYDVINCGESVLPASIGAHPAFNWPLAPNIAKEDYTLVFEADEPAPVRRLAGGLMRPESFPNPIEGRVLRLSDALFVEDALILDQAESQSVRFAAPQGPGLEIAWFGFPELGLWSKPGAPFLCIEPWSGYASPVDFEGDFYEKPGLSLIPPGATRSAALSIRPLVSAQDAAP